MSDKDQLKKIIKEIASMENNVHMGRHHMSEDCLFIRPTGNPLDMQQWDAMMNSSSLTKSYLVDIYKLVVNGNMAYSCYSTHSQFSYKGQDNNDIAVFTGVFMKNDEKWQLVHGQRSTGRHPNDDMPQFD
jgi:ketosteroid isomerase-like protein|tara:strand:+ start:272 stop:661 length:390 start_codon:yes stop_codon:yes gene_type:complete